MEIKIERRYPLPDYTIGKLSVDGQYLCDTMEDTDRGLEQGMTLAALNKLKIKGRTAIPKGRYEVKITWSPKYRRMMPILCNVPAYEGIRIHSGNYPKDTEGCILPGMNKKKGMVCDSRKWTNILYKKIDAAIGRKDRVWITIE